MSKINLEKVLSLLLSEGKEAASPLMHQYIVETCLDINAKILKEDDDVETIETEETNSTPSILTVFYKDEDGDCDADAAILAVLGRDDMDGAAWADGIRTLVFQFDSEDEADDAAEALEKAQEDETSGIPNELTTDVTDVDFSEEDEIEEDNSDGQESPLSEITPEIENTEVQEDDDSEEVEDTETEVVTDFSDIFKDPEESTDEKIVDLATEIEEMKRKIAELEGNEADVSVQEEYKLEPVKAPKNVDGELLGDKERIATQTKSPIAGNNTPDTRIDGGAPIVIDTKDTHNGYERQPAPPVKQLNLGNNVRKNAKDGMEVVSKEGDKSAIINEPVKVNDKSVIA